MTVSSEKRGEVCSSCCCWEDDWRDATASRILLVYRLYQDVCLFVFSFLSFWRKGEEGEEEKKGNACILPQDLYHFSSIHAVLSVLSLRIRIILSGSLCCSFSLFSLLFVSLVVTVLSFCLLLKHLLLSIEWRSCFLFLIYTQDSHDGKIYSLSMS